MIGVALASLQVLHDIPGIIGEAVKLNSLAQKLPTSFKPNPNSFPSVGNNLATGALYFHIYGSSMDLKLPG